MRTPMALALLATLGLAACGGGGGSTVVPSNPGSGSNQPISTQSASEDAVTTADAFGSPVKSLTSFNNGTSAIGGVGSASGARASAETLAIGQCSNDVEFLAPDSNGDANSTEEEYFYDAACTQPARDVVRIYTISGTSETNNRTVKLYAINNATPIAVRSEAVSISAASFDTYGYPKASAGFDRSATGELDLSGTKTIVSDDELVLLPAANGVNQFCGDHANYNATGFANLGETFGSDGGALAGGTRTVNADGSVTWQSTNAGNTYKGAIGSLSVAFAAPNTACPISKPEYAIGGGTTLSSYSIPMSVTFKSGVLQNLTITNAQLANGDTLNVQTNGTAPTSAQFITGSIAKSGTQIATFAVDAFGDGTLTVTSSGKQYVMTDWHVIK